jgi:hypothetical protein
MQEPEPTGYRIWISVGLALLGVSLIGVTVILTDDPAHILLTRLIQLLMTISGSICIILAVILYFVRDSPDLHQ